MPERSEINETLELPFGPSLRPQPEQFPFNEGSTRVDDIVDVDLRASSNPLVITSYTSLDRVLEFLARFEHARQADPSAPRHARIVLGHEPSRSRRKDFRDKRQRFTHEISEYWLSQGISIARSAQIIASIHCIQAGAVEVRTSGDRVIHAKIYIADTSATVGSSNYSHSGMRVQAEANCRFNKSEDEVARFDELVKLAEAIWTEAAEYRQELLELLHLLLREVDWKEALARACAELLTGRWATRFFARDAGEQGLWPSQLEGIGQALWVLDTVGSVLIADATGSGKTRMGVHLLGALRARRARMGKAGPDPSAIICPPAVEPLWKREAITAGVGVTHHSHGILSSRSSVGRDDTLEAIRRATVLTIDEAHNYLNRTTARTQLLYQNMAEHVILFTATPINRGTHDLLAIVDLLGADNFEKELLDTVQAAWDSRSHKHGRLSPALVPPLREAVGRFTVRRTKAALNRLIDREPAHYRNHLGNLCRYPDPTTLSYPCNESPEDCRLALEIRTLADKLLGLGHLRKTLRVPRYLVDIGITPEQYLQTRLASAKGLAKYQVLASLRSSRAALFEHIRGTNAANERFELLDSSKRSLTGNVIGRIKAIRGKPPKSELTIALPEALASADGHAQACDREIEIYEAIEALIDRLSENREDAKTGMLLRRLRDHQRVLAFDTFLITLHDLRRRLLEAGAKEVLLATGENKAQRDEVQRAFKLDSNESVIALCSDALSEGVNLQGASAVALLDTPTVIRRAEQRIGRIDRLDSPHSSIEIFWPHDAPEFAVRSNELLLSRYQDVADLLGTNFELPPQLQALHNENRPITGEELGRIVREFTSDDLDDIRDAFYPVRMLVDGGDALVPGDVYESVRTSTSRILTAVSVVRSPARWGFYAISGGVHSVPRWVFLPHEGTPIADLSSVADHLRDRLGGTVVQHALDEEATHWITRDLQVLERFEENFLPKRKQRALELLRKVLADYAKASVDHDRKLVLRKINNLLTKPPSGVNPTRLSSEDQDVVNLESIADWWLKTIRPVWHQHLSDRRRKRPARLLALRSLLLETPIKTERLETLFDDETALWTRPLAHRVISVIVGVPEDTVR